MCVLNLFVTRDHLLGVNPVTGSWVSNQNLSPSLRALNCLAKIQAKVGPSSPPPSGFSEIAPLNTSMSSGCLVDMGREGGGGVEQMNVYDICV